MCKSFEALLWKIVAVYVVEEYINCLFITVATQQRKVLNFNTINEHNVERSFPQPFASDVCKQNTVDIDPRSLCVEHQILHLLKTRSVFPLLGVKFQR